jgi:hypothetical protein
MPMGEQGYLIPPDSDAFVRKCLGFDEALLKLAVVPHDMHATVSEVPHTPPLSNRNKLRCTCGAQVGGIPMRIRSCRSQNCWETPHLIYSGFVLDWRQRLSSLSKNPEFILQVCRPNERGWARCPVAPRTYCGHNADGWERTPSRWPGSGSGLMAAGVNNRLVVSCPTSSYGCIVDAEDQF